MKIFLKTATRAWTTHNAQYNTNYLRKSRLISSNRSIGAVKLLIPLSVASTTLL